MRSSLTNLSAEDRLIILDKVLGDEERIELPPKEKAELWQKLQNLEPIESSSSFHIHENVYLYDGCKYSACWELASKDTKPFTIELIQPRKRLIPQQLELF